MCFEAFFEIVDIFPGDFGIVEQRPTLLVEEGGFLKVLLVESDVKISYRCSHSHCIEHFHGLVAGPGALFRPRPQ